jgi:hypothetical protein
MAVAAEADINLILDPLVIAEFHLRADGACLDALALPVELAELVVAFIDILARLDIREPDAGEIGDIAAPTGDGAFRAQRGRAEIRTLPRVKPSKFFDIRINPTKTLSCITVAYLWLKDCYWLLVCCFRGGCVSRADQSCGRVRLGG